MLIAIEEFFNQFHQSDFLKLNLRFNFFLLIETIII